MRIFRVVFWVFLVLYALAMAVFVVGWFGLFGFSHDPLAGVFLIPLGLPWNFAGDLFPLAMQPYVSLAAPLITLEILRRLSKPKSRKAQTEHGGV